MSFALLMDVICLTWDLLTGRSEELSQFCSCLTFCFMQYCPRKVSF